jgi:hypothetical protein
MPRTVEAFLTLWVAGYFVVVLATVIVLLMAVALPEKIWEDDAGHSKRPSLNDLHIILALTLLLVWFYRFISG